MTATPPHLYKYAPPTLQTLHNLRARTLFFGSPLRFNDPYDCALIPRVKAPTLEQVAKLRCDALSDQQLSPQARQEVFDMTDEQLVTSFFEPAKAVIKKRVDEFIATHGVTCFSETNNNHLMWSHYADRGQGICLEFDTSTTTFQKVLKVDYFTEVPEIDLTEALLESNFNQVLRIFCTKSSDWSYEREWRGIHAKANTSYTYDARCLRAVYFGTEVKDALLDTVCLILQGGNEHVRFFKGLRQESSYNLNFIEFSYANYLESKRLKGK